MQVCGCEIRSVATRRSTRSSMLHVGMGWDGMGWDGGHTRQSVPAGSEVSGLASYMSESARDGPTDPYSLYSVSASI